MKKHWYALYTKPRWEKKVYQRLADKGFDCYCPLNKIYKKWSDRVKLVEEPLFKSYVFVRIGEEEIPKVRMVNGVLNFVYWLGKPAALKSKEIDRIKRFLNDYEDITVEPSKLSVADNVVVTSGIFMDQRGKILSNRGSRVELEIESLGYKLVAYVDKKSLVRVNTAYQG